MAEQDVKWRDANGGKRQAAKLGVIHQDHASMGSWSRKRCKDVYCVTEAAPGGAAVTLVEDW